MNTSAETALLVILPPSNIAKQVQEIQDKVFSETGLYSAKALPQFIPLACLPAENSRESFSSKVKDISQSCEITAAGFCAHKGSIFLETELSDAFKIVQNNECLIPVYSGFFICSCLNQNTEIKPEEIITLLQPSPEIRFNSFNLGLLEISCIPENIWNEIYWEIAEEKKLRKPEVI